MALKLISLPNHGTIAVDPEAITAIWRDDKINVQSNYYWRFIQISGVHGILASLAYNAAKTERLDEDYKALIEALGLR